MTTFGVHVYKENFAFTAAHFLIFTDGSREPLHGHNYWVTVELEGELEADLVLDFGALKPIVREACRALHHKTILPRDSAHLEIQHGESNVEVAHAQSSSTFSFPAQDTLILPLSNTSTERLAEYLLRRIVERLRAEHGDPFRFTRIEVRVEETRGQAGFCRERFDDDPA